MADRTLKCEDCGSDFIFSESEQQFYQEKGFEHDPKRCPDCRKNRKAKKNDHRGGGRGSRPRGGFEKKAFEVTCNSCGIKTTVPFEPRANTPVYCRSCFESQRR